MSLRFVDLFAGLGGFHVALQSLGGECVFASEIDEELRMVYARNFPRMAGRIHGDLRTVKSKVPSHDVLCAGFPCQPFSKSGRQLGTRDELRGTLLEHVIDLAGRHLPPIIVLENVGNFERQGNGRPWKRLRSELQQLGYAVYATTHRRSGGPGLLSPHQFGLLQRRERFYVVATLGVEVRPLSVPHPVTRPDDSFLGSDEDPDAIVEAALAPSHSAAIEIWDELIAHLGQQGIEIPSFPLWSDEFGARYPTADPGPSLLSTRRLRLVLKRASLDRSALLERLPPYARGGPIPEWKRRIIDQNRFWYATHKAHFPSHWLKRIRSLAPSYRKLEWNVKGGVPTLWAHNMQFRPSGLRVYRADRIPALVAMTTSQVPIVGRLRRYLTRREALQLQGFPASFFLPEGRGRAFAAIGNAVHPQVLRLLLAPTIANALYARREIV